MTDQPNENIPAGEINAVNLEQLINSRPTNNDFHSDRRFEGGNSKFQRDDIFERNDNQASSRKEEVGKVADLNVEDAGEIISSDINNDAEGNMVGEVEHSAQSETEQTEAQSQKIEELQKRINELEAELSLKNTSENHVKEMTVAFEKLLDHLTPLARKTDEEFQTQLINFIDELIIERVGEHINAKPKAFYNRVLRQIKEMRKLTETTKVALCQADFELIQEFLNDNIAVHTLTFVVDETLRRSEYSIETQAFKYSDKIGKPLPETEL